MRNLRVTTYDTAAGAAERRAQALKDGNRLILGPLLVREIPPLPPPAPRKRAADLLSNDAAAAARDVFVMGNLPGQSIIADRGLCRARGHHAFRRAGPERRIRRQRVRAALCHRGAAGKRAAR
jgi:branched-chain amino acid transport system substrate-binding protein